MHDDTGHRLLRIFISESDTHDGTPLHQVIVETLRRAGVAGATVLRGIEGFGRSATVHTGHILRLADDLPLVIECVDTAARIDAVLPTLEPVIGDGLVTVESVEVWAPPGGVRDPGQG